MPLSIILGWPSRPTAGFSRPWHTTHVNHDRPLQRSRAPDSGRDQHLFRRRVTAASWPFPRTAATLAVIVGDVVKLYDVGSGAETGTITATGSMTIAISPDGRSLYAAGWGRRSPFGTSPAGTKLRSFGETSRGVDRIALSFDGHPGWPSPDHTTRRIFGDTATGRQLAHASPGTTDSITTLAFSPGGTLALYRRVTSPSKYGISPRERRSRNLVGHTRASECIAVSPDGATLASASNGDGVFLWGLPAG